MPVVPHVPLHWRFPAHPASVPLARHAVVRGLPEGLAVPLGAGGGADLGSGLASDLALLASELVTNAVRHGAREGVEDRVELLLWPADGYCWLAVSDPGTGARAPQVTYPDAESESGRGLMLVDRLAGAWAVRSRPGRGRSVVAGLPLSGTGG